MCCIIQHNDCPVCRRNVNNWTCVALRNMREHEIRLLYAQLIEIEQTQFRQLEIMFNCSVIIYYSFI